MFKSIAKLIIASLLSILLVTSNAYAFHKNGKAKLTIDAKEELKKRDIQAEYCTVSVKKDEEVIKAKKKKKKDTKKKSEKLTDEEIDAEIEKIRLK